ncbi:MAG TPA: hypothetical protein VFF52_01415 [Isosphaeraceae bacterium]|nr:hypothetical protein [Isosphaeraceae bacterium]
MRRILFPILVFWCMALSSLPRFSAALAQEADPARTTNRLLRAGAAAVEIAPQEFPVLVNGGFLPARATRVNDPIRARCLVLDDGSTRLAIVVVDSCMMPRELLDRAKALAREKTGIPIDRMLISATHTHSAPSAMGALGTPADAHYVAILPVRIAESIERATRNLEPARLGWSVLDDHEHTFCRRWIRRPDRMIDDPFGQRTVRANMHPGYQNPDAIAPSGPVDPGLTVLSVQSRAGRPIAVLANYSMHYYGAQPVSADYYGRFAAALAKRIGGATESADPPFVAIMSQGTSGDQMWMNYGQPRKDPGLDAYADAVAQVALQAYQSITYHDQVPLAMTETTLVLGRRVPDAARLSWARAVIAKMGDRDVPRTLPEVYAREAIFLHQEPRRELKLQAIRIGELGITAIPNEVFAITGLKLKAQSPFDVTMNIELANGSEGYIPPPEQHALGGYTTWPARTAGLEVQAEPKIVAALLGLLEQVAGKPRRALRVPKGPYAEAVLASKPLAYWRLDEMQGPTAVNSTGHEIPAGYMGDVAFYLPGPDAAGLSAGNTTNRAAYFAGGLFKAGLAIQGTYSVELWFWNGLPNEVRPITGHLFAIGGGRRVEGLRTIWVSAARKWPRAASSSPRARPPARPWPARPRLPPRPGTTSPWCVTADA